MTRLASALNANEPLANQRAMRIMVKANLTAEYLRQILHYDKSTGLFSWAAYRGRSRFKPGDAAGTVGWRGYIVIKIDYRAYRGHRLAWLYTTGKWPKDQIDHINGTRSDNRFKNLRECTNGENSQNQGRRSTNTSGFQGVHKDGNKWAANICVKANRIHLGLFDTPKKAGAVYAKAKKKYHIYSPVFLKNR